MWGGTGCLGKGVCLGSVYGGRGLVYERRAVFVFGSFSHMEETHIY